VAGGSRTFWIRECHTPHEPRPSWGQSLRASRHWPEPATACTARERSAAKPRTAGPSLTLTRSTAWL